MATIYRIEFILAGGGSHRREVHGEVFDQVNELNELEAVCLAPLLVRAYCGHIFHAMRLAHLEQKQRDACEEDRV